VKIKCAGASKNDVQFRTSGRSFAYKTPPVVNPNVIAYRMVSNRLPELIRSTDQAGMLSYFDPGRMYWYAGEPSTLKLRGFQCGRLRVELDNTSVIRLKADVTVILRKKYIRDVLDIIDC